MSDVIVMGAGMAGLVAALRLRQAGRQVTLLTKGIGGIQLGQGTLDVLGYLPADLGGARVENPLEGLARLAEDRPHHPYAALGAERVRRGVDFLVELLGPDHLVGEVERNRLYPTAVGAMRPTALVPPSMAAGECTTDKRFVIVGIRQLKDFYPQLVAENLARTDLPGGRLQARSEYIDFSPFERGVDFSALQIARALDDPARRREFVEKLRPLVRPGETVGLPAVLGATDPTVWRQVAAELAAEVFEIPLPPPSVPGWRQNDALVEQVRESRVRLVNGTKVLRARVEDGLVRGVTLHGTGREQEYTADHFVLATGGFESGALVLDSYNQLHETIFDLPVRGGTIDEMVHGDYWGADQPLFTAGLATDDAGRVVDDEGTVVYRNLYAAGGILAGAQRWSEKSGEGIALASAIRATDTILGSDADELEGNR